MPFHSFLSRFVICVLLFIVTCGFSQTVSTWVGTNDVEVGWSNNFAWSTAPIAPVNGQPAGGNIYKAVVERVAGKTNGPSIMLNRLLIPISGFEFSDGLITALNNTPPLLLMVNGPFTWTGGTLDKYARTAAHGGITIGTNAVGTPPTLGEQILTNAAGQTATHLAGTLNFMNTDELLRDGGTFQNNGQFVVNGASGMHDPSGSGMGNRFLNAGTFTLTSAFSNTYNANVAFWNSGTVNVNNGTLSLLRGGTSTAGIFNVPNGSHLRFRGPHTFDAATVFSGHGTNEFGMPLFFPVLPDNGVISNAYNFPGHTILSSGSLTFTVPPTLGKLTIADGSLKLPTNATMTVTGLLTLVEGGISSGARVLAAGGTFFAHGGSMQFTGIQFTNPAGQIARTEGSGGFRLLGASTFFNNGTFEAAGFGSVNFTGSSNRFFNNGTLVRHTGLTTFSINAPLTNRGTVSVETGILQLNTIDSGGGSFTASAGAELDLQGTCNFDATTSIGGMGLIEFSSGNFAIYGPYNVPGTTLVRFGSPTFLGNSVLGTFFQYGGVAKFQGPANISTLVHSNGICIFSGTPTIGVLRQLAFSFNDNTIIFSNSTVLNTSFHKNGGTLTIVSNKILTLNGMLNFTNGVFNGGGTVMANGGTHLPAIEKDLDGVTFVNPPGRTATYDGATTGNLNFLNGAVFDNQGTFLAQNNRELNEITTGNTFKNSGTFTRDTATGTCTVDTDFLNSGTVNVNSGRLTFASSCNFTQMAGIFRLNGGALTKSGSAMFIEGGLFTGSGTNTGALTMQGGTLAPGQSAGAIIITGNLTLGSNATFVAEIGGTNQGTQYDFVSEAGNAALSLNGTLAVTFINGFESSVQPTDVFTILTSSANLLGRFLNVTNGGRLNTSDGFGSFQVIYGTNSNRNVVLSNFVDNAAQPRIRSITVTSTNVTLTWNPFGDLTSYRVLSSTSLVAGTMTSLVSSVGGGATNATFARPAGGTHFFRVVSP